MDVKFQIKTLRLLISEEWSNNNRASLSRVDDIRALLSILNDSKLFQTAVLQELDDLAGEIETIVGTDLGMGYPKAEEKDLQTIKNYALKMEKCAENLLIH